MSKAKLPFAFDFNISDFVTLTQAEEDADFVPVIKTAFHIEVDKELLVGRGIDNGDYLEACGFYEFIEENEGEYGVHDVGFSEPWFFGYTTYEVEPEHAVECVNKIREFFINKGFTCSEVESSKNTLEDEVGWSFERAFVEQPDVYDIWNAKFVTEEGGMKCG